MIVRVVKMTFREDQLAKFFSLFEKQKTQIREFEGCLHLELLQDVADPRICFTYSHWDSEGSLDAYRHSDFFRETWQQTKALFEAKPEAWTLQQRSTPETY